MQTEIEATFLGVDHDVVRAKLRELGAMCTQPQHSMRRTTFDYEDLRLDKKAAWIRVREEADKVTMAYKQRNGTNIDDMHELEFAVENYDKACDFLTTIGLSVKAQQETKREVWKLSDCEIMLDEWPWIPPYVEVEGLDETTVRSASEQLGFVWQDAVFDSADGVYMHYFDVTRTEISTCPIVFGEVPAWLAAKRKS